jgi:signal transduction histidine kinase
MTKTPHATSGSRALRPRARIIHTLGDELVSSATVALSELVKNSYDADSTRVMVRFQESLKKGQGRIEVIDNGNGMDLDIIQTAWLEPATNTKKRRTRSDRKKRRVLGEKGVGRFAAARLAENLEVITRRVGSASEIHVFFDWKQFDDEEKYLDEVEIPWDESTPSEICEKGTVKELWRDVKNPKRQEMEHGTVLRMEKLCDTWDEEQLLELRTVLARLISPFMKAGKGIGNDFQIFLDVPAPFDYLSGPVSSPETLQNPHYSIKGEVGASGQYDLTLKLRDKSRPLHLKGIFKFEDEHKPKSGPFFIELRVWDRDPRSLKDMAGEYETTISDFRRDLDKAAGINIYRDGFRVLPYGEPRNDWLRLDLRRVQNPTLRLSNNQILGYVTITADRNKLLRDQSNREGLMEGQALDDLRELVTFVLNELELRRYDIRHPPEDKQTKMKSGGLFANLDLKDIRDLVKGRHPEDKQLLSIIEEKQKSLGEQVEEVQNVLARYHRLATLGTLIDTVLHDGRAPLAKISNEAFMGVRDASRADLAKPDGLLIQRLGSRFDVIQNQSDVMATVFRKIEPFGGRKSGRPAEITLEEVIKTAFSVLDTRINKLGVQLDLPETVTKVTVDQAEVQEVIVNLLDNSLHWLTQIPKDQREISVQVKRREPNEVEIIFSDSGPGVKDEFRERIFQPYFSTKRNGVGLGLTIAGEIIKDYYAGDLDLIDGGPLQGATFRIILRRRV